LAPKLEEARSICEKILENRCGLADGNNADEIKFLIENINNSNWHELRKSDNITAVTGLFL